MHASENKREYLKGRMEQRSIEYHRSSRASLYQKIETMLHGSVLCRVVIRQEKKFDCFCIVWFWNILIFAPLFTLQLKFLEKIVQFEFVYRTCCVVDFVKGFAEFHSGFAMLFLLLRILFHRMSCPSCIALFSDSVWTARTVCLKHYAWSVKRKPILKASSSKNL